MMVERKTNGRDCLLLQVYIPAPSRTHHVTLSYRMSVCVSLSTTREWKRYLEGVHQKRNSLVELSEDGATTWANQCVIGVLSTSKHSKPATRDAPRRGHVNVSRPKARGMSMRSCAQAAQGADKAKTTDVYTQAKKRRNAVSNVQ